MRCASWDSLSVEGSTVSPSSRMTGKNQDCLDEPTHSIGTSFQEPPEQYACQPLSWQKLMFQLQETMLNSSHTDVHICAAADSSLQHLWKEEQFPNPSSEAATAPMDLKTETTRPAG